MANNTDKSKRYLYSLDSTSRKAFCPQCRHRSLVLYINQSTGEPLDPTVGRCDHQNSCGYHLPPRVFLKAYPDFTSTSQRWRHELADRPAEQPKLQQSFIPISLLTQINDQAEPSDNLLRFFIRRFGREKALEVFHLYNVGPSTRWLHEGGCATAFPQINTEGKVCQVKVIAYNAKTGHRLHEEDTTQMWSQKQGKYFKEQGNQKVWFAGKTLLGDQEAHLCQTYFGAHLLPTDTEARVCLCESEKTAMVAHLYIRGIWLATGGKNGCRWTEPEVAAVLRGRKVVLYPDLGCMEAWAEGAAKLRSQGITVQVSRFLEERATPEERSRGLDIADFLLACDDTSQDPDSSAAAPADQ
ncbi:MAG: DUF6371 domain-containing protein [Prevotellaceae bacterium]|nr:DUF6371 domain-containing protein [Prevotellaceae bacterium]